MDALHVMLDFHLMEQIQMLQVKLLQVQLFVLEPLLLFVFKLKEQDVAFVNKVMVLEVMEIVIQLISKAVFRLQILELNVGLVNHNIHW